MPTSRDCSQRAGGRDAAGRGPAAALQIDADGDQLAQALWAILQNAAEVADTVTLTIEHRRAEFSIRIGDNGPGIAPSDAEAIFRPFFTTEATGSGIGLALARQVFRCHGGDLVLAGSDRGATAFDGTLPIG